MTMRLLSLLLLCACAAPTISRDERRTPRGWTIDTSNQDLRAVNIREEKAFGEGKTIEADNFSAESLTTEATLVSGDSKEQFQQLIEDFNQLLCVNNALEQSILEIEDSRCFARVRTPQELEVHVSTAISALRDGSKWPKFTVEIGGEDTATFKEAYAPDSGTVVFRKKLAANDEGKRIYNMAQLVKQITLKLTTDEDEKTGLRNHYLDFEEAFGDDTCLARHLWGVGTCKKGYKANLKDRVIIEYNKLIITRVEIYLRFADDKNLYKIFSSRSSRDKPLTVLDNSHQVYMVTGFYNNPHWLLHYYSSKCNAWDNPNHDGTEFGKYIWSNYIKKDGGEVDIFASPLQCSGSSAVPVSIHPAELDSNSVDVEAWLEKHKNEFKPYANNSNADCQPRTAIVIKDEALQEKKCGKDSKQPQPQPADLDKWSEERLENGVKYMLDVNKEYNRSNESFITRHNKETGSGCFYKKPLLEGIQVKIHGQELVSVSGKLMTRREAQECIFDQTNISIAPPANNTIYINLGLNAQSYPLTHTIDNNQDGTFRFELDDLLVKSPYTEKFAMRDLSYVYLAKPSSLDFFSNKVISKLEQESWGWKADKVIDGVTVPVEVGIFAIRSIAISVSGNVIYEAGVDLPAKGETDTAELCENEGKAVIDDILFILSNRNNSWQDYNLRGNKAWTTYRDDNDHCAEETE